MYAGDGSAGPPSPIGDRFVQTGIVNGTTYNVALSNRLILATAALDELYIYVWGTSTGGAAGTPHNGNISVMQNSTFSLTAA
jgi:hypothetical protein